MILDLPRASPPIPEKPISSTQRYQPNRMRPKRGTHSQVWRQVWLGRCPLAMKNLPQADLRPLQYPSPGTGQVLARSIHVERQHRHGRAVRTGFSAVAGFGRMFQRSRDRVGITRLEDLILKIERVTVPGDFTRPFATTPFRHRRSPVRVIQSLRMPWPEAPGSSETAAEPLGLHAARRITVLFTVSFIAAKT